MWSCGALCDEFHVNSRLFFKLEIAPSRETLLHFFERIRRAYPGMSRMRRRDDGCVVLDEEPGENGSRRFVRVDRAALKFGFYAPPARDAVAQYGELILTQAPAHLSLSGLDADYMEVVFTFDLEYRGNHDELVAETLFGDHPLMAVFANETPRVIDCQPFFGVALSDDCDLQGYVEVKGRTTTYEVRAGEYEAAPLSVCATLRQYSGFTSFDDPAALYRSLLTRGEAFVCEQVVPQIVQPLAAAIASER